MSTFGRDDQELDIILLLDVSGSTAGIQKLIRQTAAQATSQLYFRDRVGVIFFDSEPYVIAPPSWVGKRYINRLSPDHKLGRDGHQRRNRRRCPVS